MAAMVLGQGRACIESSGWAVAAAGYDIGGHLAIMPNRLSSPYLTL